MSQSKQRDRRVTLALKWHYLDDCSVSEIQKRFEQHGHGHYAASTVRKYLNEEPKEAVIEQIEAKQADARVQIADRLERKHDRARDAEFNATRDEKILGVRPKTDVNTSPNPARVQDWTEIEPGGDAYPDWADPERDVVIRFTEGTRTIDPGGAFYVPDPSGSPQYEQVVVGADHDVPDRKARSFARQEQREHLEAKAEILGLSDTNDVTVNVHEEMLNGLKAAHEDDE